jgi:RNA 3'-terminal phosphate cyclase-like protein
MAATQTPPPLKFTGAKYLLQRLVLATLTGRSIRVSQIRASSHTAPGLAPYEVSFLRLLESVTNGSHIEFSYTGTTVLYKPGLITGSATGHGASGGVIRHELPAECTRGASYFIVPLCLLAPFSKAQVNVLFTGPGVITSATETGDVSVDTVRTAILPLYKNFGIENNIELRILRRSNSGRDGKGGGGEVQLVFGHQVRLPKTIHLLNAGRIKRVRGVAYSTGVAGANNARLIEAARGVLNELVPDTYIFSDVSSAPLISAPEKSNASAKKKTGLGFGLSLVAESTTNMLYSADIASPPSGGETPEDLGRKCAYQLLESIEQGGCVSAVNAATLCTLMSMGSEDVGRITIAKEVLGSEPVVQLARDLRTFGMSGWGMRDAEEVDTDEVVVSIVGKGVGNVGRKIT